MQTMNTTIQNKDNILKDLIKKINLLRNTEINSNDDNLVRDMYSHVYINWSFILYDLMEINLDEIIKNKIIEDHTLEQNNFHNYNKINYFHLNNNLNKLLDDILKQANSDNYKNIIENSPELSYFIKSEKFINSQDKLNFEIKKMFLEEFNTKY
jgi:hypothetical protein